MSLKKLPIYISSFNDMVYGNYLYIDKTQYIYNFFNGYKQYYFLSRPRRFGKSLLVSTLKALFSGNKELFRGLWIYQSNWDWQEYPVIYLDFSTISHLNAEELRIGLVWSLKEVAQTYNINIDEAPAIGSKLELLVKQLSKKNRVVILIDEYDKPILDHINNLEEAEKQREFLKSFYDTIKSLDEYLRAVFLTGVTKFARTSVFSGLNNLNDITLDPVSAKLLGYTEQELLEYFNNYIQDFAQQQNISAQDLMQELKKWYNGYRFSKLDIKVYNPFSVLYALYKQDINNYWISSGNPEFLITLLKQKYREIENLEDAEFYYNSLETFDLDNINMVMLLYQTGYLTITDYNKEYNSFKVNFPNYEIKQAFTNYLLTAITTYSLNTASVKILEFISEEIN